ncbi:phosphate uptake regulator PhoU [Natronococcus sp. A-GB1]|uniref:AbrB/MazE/SpoVT family DNA-binding domain-containing protein n=1 Tax=Natronococcus sp. A-GB1 TaxID=3037648 RepID=UPI00241C016E|nr:phosphate uptake regulator PhoU [Natronococcus sp. A-GB1]MDG5759597.1 phosphate uptake regulator PhoU [Natronococcus sp. A-GB1]
MKRKIQQLGSSTLAVTLPAGWARANDVEKGDEMIVQSDESGGSLLIIPDAPGTTGDAVSVDADELDVDALERTILAQYVLGRSLVRIESDTALDTDTLETVADIERGLMGLGIVEQTIDRVEIRCSIAPGDFELPTLLERLWRTEATMREHAVTALLDGDADAAQRTIHHERQLETLFYLFLRLIFTTYRNPRLNESVGLDTGFPLIGYRSVAQDVVLMAECAREIATMIVESDSSPPNDETTDRFLSVSAALEGAADATRSAVSAPSHRAVTDARNEMDELATAVDDAQTYLETERPEPLLELQRSLTALRSSGNHAADSLDVAGHLAARSEPDVVSDPDGRS